MKWGRGPTVTVMTFMEWGQNWRTKGGSRQKQEMGQVQWQASVRPWRILSATDLLILAQSLSSSRTTGRQIESMFIQHYSSFSKMQQVDGKLRMVHSWLLLISILQTKMCYKSIQRNKTYWCVPSVFFYYYYLYGAYASGCSGLTGWLPVNHQKK